MNIKINSLVVYKNRPGRVIAIQKKLTIETERGQVNVRLKDVQLLHEGPLATLKALTPQRGDVLAAWELLIGETTTLRELADLAFGEDSPATAWAAWKLLQDGLYFTGTPAVVVAQSADVVAEIETAREAKAAEAAAWDAFMARINEGHYDPDVDGRFLQEVTALAFGQTSRSRVLRSLKREETPEVAHALLLQIGYWQDSVNPYPLRLDVPMTIPDYPIPLLPDEARRDLTQLPAFAIDDEGNQDPDDALSWEEGRLWVHIADVAALVTPDSPVDEEARGRGANLYLPEGIVPMLPLAITTQLGLGLDEVSPALSFGIDLAADGGITKLEVVPSWVRVTRLTYAEAEACLHEHPLDKLLALAHRFERRRHENGAVHIDLPEVRVQVVEGAVVIRPLPSLQSRTLVREAMLMTGEGVARYGLAQGVPLPYTAQDAPNEIDLSSDDLANMFARRKGMSRSRQQSQPGAHAGLGLSMYVQCTSPLRRYLDLVAHQQLRAHIRGETLLDEQALMTRVGAADAISGNIRQAERLSIQHWLHVYLQRHADWQGQGVVVEQRGSRDVVLIPELAWDTAIYREKEHALNSEVVVKLTKVNVPRREAHFRFL